jgi:membrane associated rhomboid family serine protease
MNILVPGQRASFIFGMSGAIPVFVLGRWWTLLSATWLHGSFLHILFNMMWVRQLAPDTAEIIGPSRTVIVYVIAGVAGFFLSSLFGYVGMPVPFLHGAGFTLGASASIFGLLGALVHYGRKSGSSIIHAEAMRYAMILFVMGLIMPGVDNSAHLGGFLGGLRVLSNDTLLAAPATTSHRPRLPRAVDRVGRGVGRPRPAVFDVPIEAPGPSITSTRWTPRGCIAPRAHRAGPGAPRHLREAGNG